LSYSAIKAYASCPLRYFFRYIAGLPEPTIAASFLFGQAVHRAVEHHFQRLLAGERAPTAAELLVEYQAGWHAADLPVRFGKDEKADSLDRLAERMLQAFVVSDLATPAGKILGVEETLRGQIIPGLPEVLGRVDLIVETRDELVITDWKTSRSRYTQDQIEDSAAQLLLYGELAQDFAPGKRLRLEFGVLTKTKEVSIERHSFAADPAQLHRTKRVIERVWRAIAAGHYFPAPSAMNCASCPYRAPCREWPG